MRKKILHLEERILLDAAAVLDIASVASQNFDAGHLESANKVNVNPEKTQNQSNSDQSTETQNKEGDNHVKTEKPADSQVDGHPIGGPTDGFGVNGQTKILLISSQVQNNAMLKDATLDNVKAIVYNANTTSLEQLTKIISDTLDGKQAESIAFATYGNENGFNLTQGQMVTASSLQSDNGMQSFWNEVGKMVKDEGRIDLLACNVAKTEAGTALIATLDKIVDDIATGHDIDINASRDLTGNEHAGGNWVLEIGGVNADQVYFDASKLNHWTGLLDNTPYLVKDISLEGVSASPSNFVDVNGTLFFTATDGSNGTELWKSDGTADGTLPVKDIVEGAGNSNPSNFTNVNGMLYFTATTAENGLELWKSDGTADGTAMVKDIVTGSTGSSISHLTNINGTLYFTATDATNGTELWKSDGTSDGTILLKDIAAGSTSSSPDNLTNVNGTLFFTAFDATNGVELWKSDGTTSGTILLKNIASGGTSSNPQNLTNANGTLYFTAYDSTNGVELWKSNGTSSGTVLVKNIVSGNGSSNPTNFTNVNGTLYFTATDATNGTELWKSTGTSSGTVLVKDILTGSNSSIPTNLTNVNGTLYFTATDGTNGIELWKSNGTTAGTTLVMNIDSGNGSSNPGHFSVVKNVLYFTATDSSNGLEVWKSDGTANGTSMLRDINPGASSSNAANLTKVGTMLYFSADNGTNGNELWAFEANEVPVTISDVYSVNEDTILSVAAPGLLTNDTDANNDSLTASLVTGPNNGSLTLNANGSFSYTPHANFYGTDSFTYRVYDGKFYSELATATISVVGVNDVPVNQIPSNQSILEDSSVTFSNATGNAIVISDLDHANGDLKVTLAAANGTITLSNTSGLVFIAGDGTNDSTMTFTGKIADINTAIDGLTFSPNANFNGNATLTITTNDQGNSGSGGAKQDVDSVTIAVASINDSPAVVSPASISVNEDTNITFSGVNLISVSDVDAGVSQMEVSLQITNGTLSLYRLTGLTFTSGDGVGDTAMTFQGTLANINAAIKSSIFTPIANYNGAASVQISTSDLGNAGAGGALTDSKTVNISILAVNDTPINTVPSPQSTSEDAALIFSSANNNAITINDIDASGNEMQVTLTAGQGRITLADATGLTFTAGDGISDTTMTFSGTISAINTAMEGLTFLSNVNFNGNATLTVATSDLGNTGSGGAKTDSDTITIAVAAVNDAPTINSLSSVNATEDTSYTFSSSSLISIGDIDAGTNPVEVSLSVTNGTLLLSRTTGLTFSQGSGTGDTTMTFQGTLTNINAALNGMKFTPSLNYNGPASLEIQSNDLSNSGTGGALTATKIVDITVAAVNDAPINSIPIPQNTSEDTALVFSSTNNNAISLSDIDSASNIMQVTLTGANGIITLGSNEGITFTVGDGINDSTMTFRGTVTALNNALNGLIFNPNANFNGNATLTLATSDLGNTGTGGAKTDSDTISIAVLAVNDAPTINSPLSVTTNEDTALTFNGSRLITIGDIDAGSSIIDVSVSVSNGVLSLSRTTGLTFSEGSGTGNPSMNFHGTLSNINNALNGMVFRPDTNFNGPVILEIQTNDLANAGTGGALNASKTVDITVAAVNDAPIHTVPAIQNTSEDNALVFSASNNNAIIVNDFDVSSNLMQVTLTGTKGIITLGSNTGITFTVGDGINDSTMTFQGTIHNINNALEGLLFNPNSNYNGNATLSITTSDLGNTGSGGAKTDTDSITITVAAVNDAPSFTSPSTVSLNEDTSFTFSNSNLISITDVDAGSNILEVNLSVTNGNISLSRTTGLSFTDGDGTRDIGMSFSGTLSNINSALRNLVFTPDANYTGPAALQLTVDDLGNTGIGTPLSDTKTIAIMVAEVNDAPVNTLPSSQVVSEDSSLVLSVANNNAILINDLESGGLNVQVTLTANNGSVSLAQSDGLSFQTGNGLNNFTMKFSGTIANINTALDGIVFTPKPNFEGSANLVITTNDLGNGTGGIIATATDTLNILVTPLNDAPLFAGPASQITNFNMPILFSDLQGNAIKVAEIDVGNTPLEFTLQSRNGTITLGSINGLTFQQGTGSANFQMRFTGSLSDINQALNGLQFQPDQGFSGTAFLRMRANDLGGSNQGPPLLAEKRIDLQVLANANTLPAPSTTGLQKHLSDTRNGEESHGVFDQPPIIQPGNLNSEYRIEENNGQKAQAFFAQNPLKSFKVSENPERLQNTGSDGLPSNLTAIKSPVAVNGTAITITPLNKSMDLLDLDSIKGKENSPSKNDFNDQALDEVQIGKATNKIATDSPELAEQMDNITKGALIAEIIGIANVDVAKTLMQPAANKFESNQTGQTKAQYNKMIEDQATTIAAIAINYDYSELQRGLVSQLEEFSDEQTGSASLIINALNDIKK